MLRREIELGTGYMTVTDHGSLSACRKVYDIAKKAGVKPICGLEGYFRDDNCPILTKHGIEKTGTVPKGQDKVEWAAAHPDGSFFDYAKYYHISLHFMDQEAYETGVRLISKADLRAERHGSERKPLFDWSDLEELGSKNVTATSSCLAGMVQRHLCNRDNPPVAKDYFLHLKHIFKPGNFYVEVFPHDCSKNWVAGVFVTDKEGLKDKFHAGKKFKTNVGEIDATELAKEFGKKGCPHTHIVAIKNYTTWVECNRELVAVEHIEDFILNECRPLAPDGDVQTGCNNAVLYLSDKYKVPVIIGDDSHFATADEKIVQDVRLLQGGGSWRFSESYHRQTSDEAFEHFSRKMGTSEAQFEEWLDNAEGWASRFNDFKWTSKPSLPTKFYPKNTLKHTKQLIDKHGRMDWDNQAYCDRLEYEIKLLNQNGTLDLLPYFFVLEEASALYSAHGLLTGPGRGSAAGLLLAYLVGITHVDPLKYNLSVERFLTLDRVNSGSLPDIDFDFPHRDLLEGSETSPGWLRERFGDHFAQISTDMTLKLKNATKDVCRMKHGFVHPQVEDLVKKFTLPPMGVSDIQFTMGYETDDGTWVDGSVEKDEYLKRFISLYPEEWKTVQKCLGLAKTKSRHACAFVVADKPIHEFIPLTEVGGVRCTQYTAPSVEAVGGVKMDFLTVGTLKDIGMCVLLVQERNGGAAKRQTINGRQVSAHHIVPFRGQNYDVWDLPEDQDVFEDIVQCKTETVFQLSKGARQWLGQFNHLKPSGTKAIDSIEALAVFTALDRPGPLDMFVTNPDDSTGNKQHNMLVEYARRARGTMASPDVLPVFDKLIPETYGVMVFQEQLQYVYQYLTGCSGPEAESFRKDVSKKLKDKIDKVYPAFIKSAGEKIGENEAKAVWEFFVTWAKYGFNKSHAVCYSVIAYACAFLKHHYPLEWWCAVLRNGTKDEIQNDFWRYCGDKILLPDVKFSTDSFEIEGDYIRAPVSLLHGVGEGAHAQLCKYMPYTNIAEFCDKIQQHKVAGSKPTTKKVKDKKTGEVTEVASTKLGHSALNRGVVHSLIISGAMDALFPETIDDGGAMRPVVLTDKLEMFEKELARVLGKKRPEPIPEEYCEIGPLTRYQMRKKILPAYSEDILPHLEAIHLHGLERKIYRNKEGYLFDWGSDDVPIVTPEQVAIVNAAPFIAQPIIMALAVYVQDYELFTYQKTKVAAKYHVDLNGAKLELVKWPNKGGLDEAYKKNISGAIAIFIVSKYKEGKDLAIDDIIIAHDSIKNRNTKEEESGDQ